MTMGKMIEVEVDFSEDEYQMLERIADERGVTIEELVRLIIKEEWGEDDQLKRST